MKQRSYDLMIDTKDRIGTLVLRNLVGCNLSMNLLRWISLR